MPVFVFTDPLNKEGVPDTGYKLFRKSRQIDKYYDHVHIALIPQEN